MILRPLFTSFAMKRFKFKPPNYNTPPIEMMTPWISCFKTPTSVQMFFHQLSQMPEYSQFGLVAQIFLCMSPDTVECERGFSRMNLTKNKFSTRLVQSDLDARLTVSMDKRSLSTLPLLSLNVS